jgi:hypothetical protein
MFCLPCFFERCLRHRETDFRSASNFAHIWPLLSPTADGPESHLADSKQHKRGTIKSILATRLPSVL